MAVQTDVEYFARLVDALEPWLDQVVIIGVWHTASTACSLLRSRSTTNLSEPSTPTSPSLSICPLPASRFARGCSKGTSVKS